MLYSSLTLLTDTLTMLLQNSLKKRGVLENLDLVLLCLDETIDDGWEISKAHMFFLLIRVIVDTWHWYCGHRIRSQPTTTRYHGNSYQWTDNFECLPDCERKDATEKASCNSYWTNVYTFEYYNYFKSRVGSFKSWVGRWNHNLKCKKSWSYLLKLARI